MFNGRFQLQLGSFHFKLIADQMLYPLQRLFYYVTYPKNIRKTKCDACPHYFSFRCVLAAELVLSQPCSSKKKKKHGEKPPQKNNSFAFDALQVRLAPCCSIWVKVTKHRLFEVLQKHQRALSCYCFHGSIHFCETAM